jgi:hypothetical protein
MPHIAPALVNLVWGKLPRVFAVPLLFAFAACHDEAHPAAPLPPASLSATHGVTRAAPILLRGTVITPDGVLKHGYVGIADGRIVSVSDKPPKIPGAVSVNTEGIIAPGFVDVHNHVIWNVLPRWNPGRIYMNRDEWANSPEHQDAVAPVQNLEATQHCDFNAWGELRALVGGTTSILSTRPATCIHGLARNLDFNSEFYGTVELDREHIYNNVLFPPPSNVVGRAQFAGFATYLIGSPLYEALVVHAAEGTDAFSREQFTFLQSNNLLNPKGVIVHGISLTASDFSAMAAAGTALVWSPRSNLELYGATTNVLAALQAGVEVAIAPDWAITGSSNMLDELKTASRWNRERLSGQLSDRQLVDMVTSVAARIVGIDDEVGAIRPGLRADLVIVSGDQNDAPGSLIDSDPADVQLVVIGGIPVYGARALLERFWLAGDLEEIALPGGPKVLATPAAGFIVALVAARLEAALAAEGTGLAPLTETAGGFKP